MDHGSVIEEVGLGGSMRMLLEGELVAASDRRTIPATDPATGQSLGDVPCAGAEDVDQAVTCARRAFAEWRALKPHKRAAALLRLAALAKEHRRSLARVEALDVGMPITIAKKLSAGALVRNLEYYASWADKIYGEVIPLGDGRTLDYTLTEPIGVIAAVIPWNTPLLFCGSKLGPALASGNVVILKPSERASMSALKVAELAVEAGFPPGVVQVLTGDAETGAALVSHPGVDKVSFTGGGSIAKKVLEATAGSLTPVFTELGGKSPNIVFDDADIDRGAFLSALGAFGLSGQACAAGTRLLVQRGVLEGVVERMCANAKTLPVGDPLDPSTLLGPLVSTEHHERVRAHVEVGKKEGATLALAADLPSSVPDDRSFMAPHIFTDVTPEMRIWSEEIFGPVLCITAFDSEDEAVELANQTEFGLGAGIWTRDVGRAHRVAARVGAGNVWINHYGVLPVTAPFGGIKRSGWGREGGRDVLREYTHVKNVYVDLT